MREIIAIELGRYNTRIALTKATLEGVEVTKDSLYEIEPIIDYILSEQIDKITEFFLEIKKSINFEKRDVFVSLPDSILRVDLRETDYVEESRWNDEFSKAIKSAIPQLAEEPYAFTYPLVIPHEEQEGRCFVTTISVKRKYINALISGAKNANVVIDNITATSIATSRYIDEWDKPYFILNVEHDRSTLVVSFSQRGIDLVNEAIGWGEILNSGKGLEKVLQVLSLQNSRIRARKLSQIDQSLLILVSEEAEKIKDILSPHYPSVLTVVKPSSFVRLDSNLDRQTALMYAASIGLSLHGVFERRNGTDEALSNGGSNTDRRVRGAKLHTTEAKANSLFNRCCSFIGARSNL